MIDTRKFSDRVAEVDALTKKWRLTKAYRAALKLRQDYPTNADAYVLLHLIVCLTDNQAGVGGGMRYASPRLVEMAVKNVPGFEGTAAHGDMLRDQLLGLARFPIMSDSLDVARTLPDQIETLHNGDDNRLACLDDARGRLRAAEGDLLEACDLHKRAHQAWEALANGKADPSWVHFNLVHWLRTSIALWGLNSSHTNHVMDLLATENKRAPGAHGGLQIRIIRTPVVGLRVYNWLETHRMSRP